MKTWPQKQGLGPRSGWDADNRQRSREGSSKPLGGSTLLTVFWVGDTQLARSTRGGNG